MPIVLDYSGAADRDAVMGNLSGIVADGRFLWTVSDEGRTVERLEETDGRYMLVDQLGLDDLFPDLPAGEEADLESVDLADGRVWVCGSHGRVRRQPRDDKPNAAFRRRPSRHLLGSFPSDQPRKASGTGLPYLGEGSLRRRLRADPFLSPFMTIPSKENGFDVEGLAVRRESVYLGLRGPVVDGCAVVMELGLRGNGTIQDRPPIRHLLELGGLGIRDLARWGDDVLVLSGPVTSADGPFRLHVWRPTVSGASQKAKPVHIWPLGDEHPEGICRLARDGRDGVLVVYDSPNERRIQGAGYRADWFESVPLKAGGLRQPRPSPGG